MFTFNRTKSDRPFAPSPARDRNITADGFRPLRSLLALVLAAGLGLGAAPARGQKFHSGHYTIASGNAGALTSTSVPDNFRGCQSYYKWKDLEPSYGVYDFSKIIHDRDVLKAAGKRPFILLQYKAFVRNPSLCPDYLNDTPEHRTLYGGGMYRTESGSYSAVMWNNNVQARYAALIAAVGKAFDEDPQIPSWFTGHPPILPAPTNLTWSTSGNQVVLTWTDRASDETGFRIERRTDAALATYDGNGCYFAEIGTTAANVSTFTDRAVQPNMTYHYLVRACRTGTTTHYSAYTRKDDGIASTTTKAAP